MLNLRTIGPKPLSRFLIRLDLVGLGAGLLGRARSDFARNLSNKLRFDATGGPSTASNSSQEISLHDRVGEIRAILENDRSFCNHLVAILALF
jgi:hypothetical protein